MKTKMRPSGVTLEIEHNGKTYFVHLYNDWDVYKTYDNYEIEVEEMILFDDEFNRVPYDVDLYEEFRPLVEEHIFDHKHEWED